MTVYNNYIVTKKLNLNLQHLKYSCGLLYNLVNKNFNTGEYNSKIQTYEDATNKISTTTKLYSTYNLFMYPYDEFYNLYSEIKTFFRECCIDEEQYYIQLGKLL